MFQGYRKANVLSTRRLLLRSPRHSFGEASLFLPPGFDTLFLWPFQENTRDSSDGRVSIFSRAGSEVGR
jgi:hypothetical protein